MAMTSKISEWLQVIGMFGVIASLVFVGLQMRQTHEIALSSIYQSRSNAVTELNMSTTGSPELLSAIAKSYTGRAGEISTIERVALEQYVAANFYIMENSHR
jgi:hypothetical protein